MGSIPRYTAWASTNGHRLAICREDLQQRYSAALANFETQAMRLEHDRIGHPFYKDAGSDYHRHGEVYWCHKGDSLRGGFGNYAMMVPSAEDFSEPSYPQLHTRVQPGMVIGDATVLFAFSVSCSGRPCSLRDLRADLQHNLLMHSKAEAILLVDHLTTLLARWDASRSSDSEHLQMGNDFTASDGTRFSRDRQAAAAMKQNVAVGLRVSNQSGRKVDRD